MKRKLFSVILILSVLLGPVSGAQPNRVQAAGPTCYVNDTATGLDDGSSWANAYRDLQAALGDPGCTTILVAEGTYHPSPADRTASFQLRSGVQIRGGWKEDGSGLQDPTVYRTVLDGDIGNLNDPADNSYHVVNGSEADATSVLDGFYIEDGKAIDLLPFDRGGGIFIENGNPTLRRLTISRNSAAMGGAGMYLLNSSPSITYVAFQNNTALDDVGLGGGLWSLGDSNPVLTDVVFEGNYAYYGGGFCSMGRNTNLTSVQFIHNKSNSGGGMYNRGTAMIDNVVFQMNEASDFGGGLYNFPLFSGFVQNSQFISNTAGINGGGIYNNRADIVLLNVILEKNQAGVDGGGIHTWEGNASILNSHISSNTAAHAGGGLYADGPVTMIKNFIDINSAGFLGGGLFSEDRINMTSCLVNQNYAYDEGGGLALFNVLTGSTFTNLTVTGNSTDTTNEMGDGGGIFIYGYAPVFSNLLLSGNTSYRGGGMAITGLADPVFVNTTIYGNHVVAAGSAIFNNNSHPQLTNSIVWGNTDDSGGPDIENIGLSPSTTLISSILEDQVCPPGFCTDVLYEDPQIADPLNGDFRPLPDSPAVDAGRVDALPQDIQDLDGDGNTTEGIPIDLGGRTRVVMDRVDIGAYEAQIWNTNWTQAADLELANISPGVDSVSIDRYLEREGQSRWYRFTVQPSSKVLVTLTSLPANYDLTLYQDIAQAYTQLDSSQDLVQINAEFAPDTFSPDTFSPDTFSPDTFSPDTFSPDTFSPDTFSPDTFSPDTFSPDTYSPDTFSPDTFSPDTFSPDTFSPDTFSPDTFSPDTFSPDTFSPDTFSPDTFSSAQTRSLIAVSAHEGTLGEGILINTWVKSGEFYVRVRGRNGAFDNSNPFHLQVTLLSGVCGQVTPVLYPSTTLPDNGNYQALILTNPGRMEDTSAEKQAMLNNLSELAARTGGRIVDVGADTRVNAASIQADSNPACVYAKNLEAYAIKEIVDGFWALNPLEYIVLVGNDNVIPFFRYPDNALLASEIEYSPPVLDNTTSQASLKNGYILTQDTYGATIELSYDAQSLPIPDLAVGRLVETTADINTLVQAYLDDADGIVPIDNALVTGYDFLEDAANAVRDELEASLDATVVDTLIMSSALSPEDPSAWTADDLRTSLLGNPHDLVFLAGHFSATGTLAADYHTRMTPAELLASTTNFTNSLVYSAGCHSGYNIVNAHDVPNWTEEPDWAQAFAAKGATFIGGTGYQYGDTDFIEYSERLYLELTRQLRYGTVPIGEALVKAKQAYLAGTPLMRGLHEKSLLEATLFGLPMLQFALPVHIQEPVDTSIVSSTSDFATGPGNQLDLAYADLSLAPSLIEQTLTLDVISETGGMATQVQAVYLKGPDGVVVNAAEPVLPLDMLNVTHPNSDYVLRGAGWRGGSYTDLLDRLPLTGAATSDLRAPHPAFFSNIFYPVRPWNINYFDALRSEGGPTRLALMPAQYISSAPGTLTGTLRQFDRMDFRLYYSSNITTYENTDYNWANTPALAAPPDISHISSTINADGTISFEITVTGDPAAGIQEAWIVYTGASGSLYGAWLPLDLLQDMADTRLWKGTLSIGSTSAANLRFVVQAANGVGLVTMMTNEGAYYRAGVDPGAPSEGQIPVTLTLINPTTSGSYGGTATFTAFASRGGTPLAGLPVAFHLGEQRRLAVTGNDGQATTSFFLLAHPGEYTLRATSEEDGTYAYANAADAFKILPGTSSVALKPAELQVMYGDSPEFIATVTSAGLPLSHKPVALTLESGGTRLYTNVTVTDYAGRATWQVPILPPGSYSLTAWFGLPVLNGIDLSNPFYAGASSTALLVVNPFNEVFSGFFPPVENPPVFNKVKAGSALPVKFSLGGDFGLDIFASGYPLTNATLCQTGNVDIIEETVSAGESSLSYDPLTDQYTYVWKTDKKWAGTCQTLILKFIDGVTVKTALFQFTK